MKKFRALGERNVIHVARVVGQGNISCIELVKVAGRIKSRQLFRDWQNAKIQGTVGLGKRVRSRKKWNK